MNVKNHKWMLAPLCISITLTACASPPAVADGLTLAATKSPVQLLRNEAVSRVDPAKVEEVRVALDSSTACFDDFANPDGLVRQWISSAELVLAEGADLTDLADGLVGRFESDGWERNDLSTGDSFSLTVLSSPDSVAKIQVEASAESDGAVIVITSTGPCVDTAGPDSDEVQQLEGR